jgi:hypothetical protein
LRDYFGCEADDRMNAMRMVPPEAHQLVEDGLMITADDFRDFTLANAVSLWGTQNPDLLEGTAVADAAAAVLG